MKNQKLQIAMLVGEIQTLVYMVNEFTDYCAFFNFSGHVCSIDVSIRASKENYADHLADTSIYSITDKPDKALEKLTTMKANLRKILRKNEIDYSRLNYSIEEVRHYKLV